MELTSTLKEIFSETANELKGHQRRLFMARVVNGLGRGGQRKAEQELGWNRTTIRKGIRELEGGGTPPDRLSERGRKSAEEHLPELLTDIESILKDQSQTDATFRTTRLYTRLSVAAVRQQLIEQKGYTEEQLPSNETLRRKINQLGYRLRTVKKSQPQKKSLKPMRSLSS